MPTKRPSRNRAAAEQLVFPFQLRVGDVVLDDSERLEVVGRPTGFRGGKDTSVIVRRDGETSPHPAVWAAWRKVRVVRSSAA